LLLRSAEIKPLFSRFVLFKKEHNHPFGNEAQGRVVVLTIPNYFPNYS